MEYEISPYTVGMLIGMGGSVACFYLFYWLAANFNTRFCITTLAVCVVVVMALLAPATIAQLIIAGVLIVGLSGTMGIVIGGTVRRKRMEEIKQFREFYGQQR